MTHGLEPWRDVAGRFRAFLARLSPGAGEIAAVVQALTDVSRLCALSVPRGRRGKAGAPPPPFPIGGYAKDTSLPGQASADVLLPLPGAGGASSRLSRGRIIDELALRLAGRYGAMGSSPDGWLTVRADPGIGPPVGPAVTVRILPALALGEGRFRPAVPRMATGAIIAPDAERAALDRADRASAGQARHLVRMAKAWVRVNALALPSLALECLVTEFLIVWIYSRRSPLFYDWMVRDFFFWLSAQGHRAVGLPGGGRLDLGGRWIEDALLAHRLAADGAQAERDNDARQATARWRRLFGPAFPEPPGALPSPPPQATIPWRPLTPAG